MNTHCPDTFITDPFVSMTMCPGNCKSISNNGTQNVRKGVHSARFEVLSVALLKTYLKVKESCYRPEGAQRVPGR